MPKSRDLSARWAAGWILLILGIGLAAYRLGWSDRPTDGIPRKARSLVLVTLDTLRADHLAPYGADFETPFFSQLAEQAVLFENAYSVAPITLVSHTSMLTGLYPPQHGVRNNGMHRADSSLDTLAERLRRRGWRTGAFVSAAVLEGRYGLDQGFEVYDDDLSAGTQRRRHMVPDRPAEVTVDSALEWLDQLAGERFFLWLHLYDPHAPYLAPEEYRRLHPHRPYAAEVAYVDAQIERLMAHPLLSTDDPRRAPVVAVIADHGESLGEHGEQTHALLAYDSTLRVPFLLSIPGGPEGIRISEPVGQVDLMPTLLDALGLSRKIRSDLPLGRSLLPLIGGQAIPRRPLYSETYLPHYTYGWSKLKVYRQGGFKLIDAPRRELYELHKDPRELTNVADLQPGVTHDLTRNLTELTERFGNADHENLQALDEESRQKLRSLGYLAIADPVSRDGEPPLDPKDMVQIHVSLEKARHFMGDRLFDLAEQTLRQALTQDPRNLAVLGELAEALTQLGRFDEAAEHLERALQMSPGSAGFYLRLATLETLRGESEKALGLVDTALRLAPDLLEAWIEKASILKRLGRDQETEKILAERLDEHPDHPRLLTTRALLVDVAKGDRKSAERRLRRAVEADPFLAPAWLLLGELLEAEQRPGEAEQAYRQGLERQALDPQLSARLGLLAARRNTDDAGGLLREAIRLSPRPRSDLFMALGGWLQARGREAEAEQLYAAWVDLDLESPLERNNQAIAYFGLGRLDEARALLTRLVERFPEYADAAANLAAVAAEQEDWPTAERFARRALDRRPDSVEPWNTLGLALDAQGNADGAIEAFDRALRLDAGYWPARLNLGDVLLAKGDVSAAEQQYLKVTEQSFVEEAHRKLAELYGGPLPRPDRAEHHLSELEARLKTRQEVRP